MHNSRRSFLLLVTLLITGLVFSVSFAQESVTITVYVDSDSFTIVVPANAGVSLDDIGFQVVRNGQPETHMLRDYAVFTSIPLDYLSAPICFRLERQGSDIPAPTACKNALIQLLANADVFWYDDLRKETLAFTVIQVTTQLVVCPNQSSCSLELPLPPTLAVTNTSFSKGTLSPSLIATPIGGGAGQIVFSSKRDGNYEIYTANADGSNLRNLTNNPAEDRFPSWSPDGNKIVFVSNRDGNTEIYVMNDDGSDAHNLTNHKTDDTVPAWSPDGTQIAFVASRRGNWEIYVMDADGGNPHDLTNNDAEDFTPSWSPDGTQIAFHSNRGGNFDIYVMDANGDNVRQLTHNPADDVSPAWSPDGHFIAFNSNRDRNYNLYMMNADGSNINRLINNSADDLVPAWSPDSNLIAFDSNRDGNYEIYIVDADGSNPHNFTNNPADDEYAAWRPTPKN